MPITALPPAPSRDTPSTFATLADAFVAALPTFVTEANALEANVNSKETLATTAATNAAISETAAEAAQAAAESASNASKWIPGTTYTEGDVRWSPIDFLSYRRKTNGGGTTDPSLDLTNWQKLGSGSGFVLLGTYNAATASAVDIENISASYDDYLIVFGNVVLSSVQDILIRVKKSGSYVTGSTYNRGFVSNNGSTWSQSYTTAASSITCIGSTSGVIFSGECLLTNANATSNQKIDVNYSSAGSSTGNKGSAFGYETTSAAVQGLRFYVSSGTFTSGTFKIYGIVKS